MRTFHTGGAVIEAGDITHGLPRVVELFEARTPKGVAPIAEAAGVVSFIEDAKGKKILVTPEDGSEAIAYPITRRQKLLVEEGSKVGVGEKLVVGAIDPKQVLKILGPRSTQVHLVTEIQEVYRSQGVSIHDKHIEIIVRQMLKRVTVLEPGDTELLPGELVDRARLEAENRRVVQDGGKAASGRAELMGITKASLATESWLSAASFQETTRVLTDAALAEKRDPLLGLKENVIIGKLIPAGTGAPDKVAARKEAEKLRAAAALAGGDLPTDFGKDDFNVFLESEEGGASQDDVSQLMALLTEEKPAAGPESEANPFLADAAEAPKGDEGGA
jgi:DNA-directed RNA polymerase subunit beta'